MEDNIKDIKKDKEVKSAPGLKYQRDRDREIVRGIFKFHEVPGGSMSFVYKKYKEDSVERYTLVDNQVCKIPLGVAKHINDELAYPVYGHIQLDGNATSVSVKDWVQRASFNSLEFTDIEGLGSRKRIINVESPSIIS